MSDGDRFADRRDAGTRLAAALADRHGDVDRVVAIPRGGLPLGRAVADALAAPLDVVVAKKIGAPHNPEYAIGAVATDGSVWRNESAIERTGADEAYFEREREQVAEQSRQKAARYRGDETEPPVAGERVVVVDDGAATGATLHACLHQLRAADAAHLTVAIPVAPPDTVDALAATADEVVCLLTPASFQGVGQFYERFGQVTDEEAIAYLTTES